MNKLQSDYQALILMGAFLETLKEDNPELHEKVTRKHREIMGSITPDSKEGPTIYEFIRQILAKADNHKEDTAITLLKEIINEDADIFEYSYGTDLYDRVKEVIK